MTILNNHISQTTFILTQVYGWTASRQSCCIQEGTQARWVACIGER